ncbi:S24 family peptidase [Galactobacillus timonensis]|uniref:helix-turn-helix domain-containing protein n=2 Tax=Galactobacillus timonensis TaxID=2041840 RepID=UPI0023F46F03|nr:S24 family peptidase [Galactobacillus timonensis]MCI6754221.1 helix-turn-helix domain-containing protein [Galactobacillus timonensis]
MDISEIVKNYRKSHGLSMDAFAKQCGVSKAYIGFIESGVNPKTGKPIVPTIETVKKMATGMRISLDEFVRMMDDNSMINVGDNVDIPLPHEEPVRDILIYGALSCGTGLFVEDEVIGHVSVPLAMLPSRSAEYFAQYASGDSMEGVGIFDGDLLVFEKTAALDNGQIGCFCIDENIATCKKFSRIGGSVMLMPANDKYQPIIISPENECFRILGRQVLRMGK